MEYYLKITWPRIMAASFVLLGAMAAYDCVMTRTSNNERYDASAFLKEKPYKKAIKDARKIFESDLTKREKLEKIKTFKETYGYNDATKAILSLNGIDVENERELSNAIRSLSSSIYVSKGINPNSEYSIEAQIFGAVVDAALDRYDPLRLRKHLPQPPGPTAAEMIEQKNLEKERMTNPALDAYMNREGKKPDDYLLERFRKYPQGAIPESTEPFKSSEQKEYTKKEEELKKGNEAFEQVKKDADRLIGIIKRK